MTYERPRTIHGFIRVPNKVQARKLYNAGTTVYLLPCKVSPGGVWVTPMPIHKDDVDPNDYTFDHRVNSFEAYNCQYNELGYYTSFYILDTDQEQRVNKIIDADWAGMLKSAYLKDSSSGYTIPDDEEGGIQDHDCKLGYCR